MQTYADPSYITAAAKVVYVDLSARQVDWMIQLLSGKGVQNANEKL